MQLPPTSTPSHRPFYLQVRFITVFIALLLIIIYMTVAFIAYDTISKGTRVFSPVTPSAPFTEVEFPSRGRDYLVKAFYIPGNENAPVLISVHGYNMSRYSDYHIQRANALHDLGYTVLSIDLSDNGGSTIQNGRISMGDSERYDVLGAFDYLLAQGVIAEKIGLVSESMGGATSLMAAWMEPSIKAIWADSPYTDVTTVFGERIAQRSLPSFVVFGGMAWGYVLVGEKLWEVRPVEAANSLAANAQAVYLVATTKDNAVYFHHGVDLHTAYKNAGVDVTFWEIPGLGHTETQQVHYEEYFSRLDAFFKAHLES